MSSRSIFGRAARSGFDLPHPPIDLRVVLVINNALIRAFEILRAEPTFTLATAKEDEITRELEDILENYLRQDGSVPGFNKQVFGRLVKSNELSNYNGEHPAKKCDLLFDLKREHANVLSAQDLFFVECKPVDNKHKIDKDYCQRGLIRFANGDYAWAMQEAMMLAYVRDSNSIQATLTPELMSSWCQQHLGQPSTPQLVPSSPSSHLVESLHVTEHDRNFVWPSNQQTAVPITIFHSWHLCT